MIMTSDNIKTYARGVGMLVGMIIGAGMFALPFAFSKSGMLWGLVNFAVAFAILLFLHLLYGEVAFFTEGKHRFTGYVEKYLGARAKGLALVITIASYYGSLLAYGILGGIFVSNFFGGNFIFWFVILNFIAGAILSLCSIEKIADINFYLTIPLLGFVAYLFFLAWPSIHLASFGNSNPILNHDWFLPYGVWMFALTGFSVLPDARDIFCKSHIRDFRRVIFASLVLSAVVYFIFTFAVWGVSGPATAIDALSGIRGALGMTAFLIGSLMGFIAVFTSFISLAGDMRDIFRYDYKMKFLPAWLLAVVPPVVLYLFNVSDLAKILEITGTIGMGFLGVFIIKMSRAVLRKISSGEIVPTDGAPMQSNRWLEFIVILGVLTAVGYELWRMFI